MSLWGSSDRQMIFLSVTVTRHLSEDDMKFTRGRMITISVPFWDLHLDDFGWSWKTRLSNLRRPGFSVWAESSDNDFRRRYHGDAIGLEGTGRYEAR